MAGIITQKRFNDIRIKLEQEVYNNYEKLERMPKMADTLHEYPDVSTGPVTNQLEGMNNTLMLLAQKYNLEFEPITSEIISEAYLYNTHNYPLKKHNLVPEHLIKPKSYENLFKKTK